MTVTARRLATIETRGDQMIATCTVTGDGDDVDNALLVLAEHLEERASAIRESVAMKYRGDALVVRAVKEPS